MSKRWDCILLFFIVFAVYFTATGNGFVWDDISLIVENPAIRSVEGVWSFFASDLHAVGDNSANFYRPIQILSFSIDYFFFGISAFWFHMSSILLHCVNVIFVYLLICLFSCRRDISFVVALLFGIHPVCTEAVTYVSGRADLLVVFFMLLSWIFFIRFLYSNKFVLYTFSVVCFLLALGSKELALIFPLMLGLCLIYFKDENYAVSAIRKRLYFLIPYFVCGFLYIVLRKTVIDFSDGYVGLQIDYSVRILSAFKLLCKYLQLYFIPVGLHMERFFEPVFSVFDGWFFAGFILVLLLLSVSIKMHRVSRNTTFGLLWFFIAITPVLNVFVVLNAFIAEHWLYFSLIGLNLFFISLLFYFLDKTSNHWIKNSVYIVLGMLIASSAVGVFTANKKWKDNISLYSNIIERGNPGFRIYNNLGNEYAKTKQYRKAIKAYGHSLKLNPQAPSIYNNLGIVYKNMGKTDKALRCYQKIQAIAPNYKTVYNNLANLYEKKGQYVQAIDAYLKAIELSPQNSKLHSNIGAVYIKTGMYNLAIDSSLKAMHLDSSNINAYNNLGVVYIKMEHYGDAVFYLEKGLDVDPTSQALNNNLQLVLRTVSYRKD